MTQPSRDDAAVRHASDSTEQRLAEMEIVTLLSAELGVMLGPGGRIHVGDGSYVQVDARTSDDRVLVEVYARQGALHGGQLKKIGQDILKFALLRQQDHLAESQLIIAFASQEAVDSIRGWVAVAAFNFGVELRLVDIGAELRSILVAAQARQVMQNSVD